MSGLGGNGTSRPDLDRHGSMSGRLADPARDAVETSVSRTPTVFSGDSPSSAHTGTGYNTVGIYPVIHRGNWHSRGRTSGGRSEDPFALECVMCRVPEIRSRPVNPLAMRPASPAQRLVPLFFSFFIAVGHPPPAPGPSYRAKWVGSHAPAPSARNPRRRSWRGDGFIPSGPRPEAQKGLSSRLGARQPVEVPVAHELKRVPSASATASGPRPTGRSNRAYWDHLRERGVPRDRSLATSQPTLPLRRASP